MYLNFSDTHFSTMMISIGSDLTIEWTIRENVKADIGARVQRILNKYGYPPDKQEKTTQLMQNRLKLSVITSIDWRVYKIHA